MSHTYHVGGVPFATMSEQSRFKIVLLGDKDVGKTSIILRYSINEFTERTSLTPISEQVKKLTVNGRQMVLELWDTAGQERYKSLETHFYREADAAILVYDVVERESFHSLTSYWMGEMIRYVPDDDMIPIIVVGNKSDLCDEAPESVDLNAVTEYTNAYDLPPPIETSAKTGHNIHKLFNLVATELYKRHMHNKPPAAAAATSGRSRAQLEDPSASFCCAGRVKEKTDPVAADITVNKH